MSEPDPVAKMIEEIAEELVDSYLARRMEEAADMPQWIAICAPGRRGMTALAAMYRPERIIEIRESRYVEGNQVYLLNADLSAGYPMKPKKDGNCP